MKTALTILLLATKFCFAQKDTLVHLPMKDGKVFYELVINADSVSKSDLYQRSKNLFLRLFPNTKEVIQNEDKELGKIVGKGNFTYMYKVPLATITNRVKFSLDITVKDGKYRVQLYDFNFTDGINDRSVESLYEVTKQKKQKWLINSFYEFDQKVKDIFTIIDQQMKKKNDNDF